MAIFSRRICGKHLVPQGQLPAFPRRPSLGARRMVTLARRLRSFPVMTIAVPIAQNHVSPLLDAATRLLLVTRLLGKEMGRKEFLLGPLAPAALARCVAELRVDVLLCAALSQGLHRELERQGVRVQPHICGEIEAVLQAFLEHRLKQPEFRMPGCWGPHPRQHCCRRQRAARLVNTTFKPTSKSLNP